MLHTSFAKLREAAACTDRYKYLANALGGVRHYGKDTLIPLDKLLKINGFDDTLWSLRATIEPADREKRLLACEYAEHVLYLFEGKYPKDKRPRQTIEVAKLFADEKATQIELAAAWDAARDAARDAAGAAAWAAARDAARDAAWAAAGSARAARVAEGEWQKARLLGMLNGEV